MKVEEKTLHRSIMAMLGMAKQQQSTKTSYTTTVCPRTVRHAEVAKLARSDADDNKINKQKCAISIP